jgi:chorismate synthase
MSNHFGQYLTLSLFGESHGAMMGVTITNLPAGLVIDHDFINRQLIARQGLPSINTSRNEPDQYRIVSGLLNNKTTGAPLTIIIENINQNSQDYQQPHVIRPSHADLSAYYKYHNHHDHRGGGSFSGRLTAPLVAAGAICQQLLNQHQVLIGSHISRALSFQDTYIPSNLTELLRAHQHDPFCVFDPQIKQQLLTKLELLHHQHDSAGGVVESFILNVPTGIGEPWFNSLESMIAHGLLSIPGIKGIEFGAGFNFALMNGQSANDQWQYINQEPQSLTNHNGGINGGITNGMPIIIRSVIKPTPSIGIPQQTINLQDQTNTTITISGRHDTFIANRALIVINNLLAFIILDSILMHYGKEWLCLD